MSFHNEYSRCYFKLCVAYVLFADNKHPLVVDWEENILLLRERDVPWNP